MVGGTLVVRDADELHGLRRSGRDPFTVIVQEYLPEESSEDWIFQGYFDDGSRPLVAFTGVKLRSWPPHAGPTTRAVSVANAEVERCRSPSAATSATGGSPTSTGARPSRRVLQAARLQPARRRAVPALRDGRRHRRGAGDAPRPDRTRRAARRTDRRTRFVVEHLDLPAVSVPSRARTRTAVAGSGPERELAFSARDDPLPFLTMRPASRVRPRSGSAGSVVRPYGTGCRAARERRLPRSPAASRRAAVGPSGVRRAMRQPRVTSRSWRGRRRRPSTSRCSKGSPTSSHPTNSRATAIGSSPGPLIASFTPHACTNPAVGDDRTHAPDEYPCGYANDPHTCPRWSSRRSRLRLTSATTSAVRSVSIGRCRCAWAPISMPLRSRSTICGHVSIGRRNCGVSHSLSPPTYAVGTNIVDRAPAIEQERNHVEEVGEPVVERHDDRAFGSATSPWRSQRAYVAQRDRRTTIGGQPVELAPEAVGRRLPGFVAGRRFRAHRVVQQDGDLDGRGSRVLPHLHLVERQRTTGTAWSRPGRGRVRTADREVGDERHVLLRDRRRGCPSSRPCGRRRTR